MLLQHESVKRALGSTGTLVMDLLWLIPGVVPGVVFLIVDFSSGTMYVR